MEDNIINELNKLEKLGRTTSEISDYIEETCTDEEKEYIKYVYHQGGQFMGERVVAAASLL